MNIEISGGEIFSDKASKTITIYRNNMEELKHTKGEWKLTKDAKGVECNGKLIVTCWSVIETSNARLDGESWLDMRKRTERERFINNELEPTANAKLITAAPNLLEALIKMVEKSSVTDTETINKAINAINKATK